MTAQTHTHTHTHTHTPSSTRWEESPRGFNWCVKCRRGAITHGELQVRDAERTFKDQKPATTKTEINFGAFTLKEETLELCRGYDEGSVEMIGESECVETFREFQFTRVFRVTWIIRHLFTSGYCDVSVIALNTSLLYLCQCKHTNI